VFYQIRAGQARRQLRVSPLRTLLHSIGRLRPFVFYGYVKTDPDANKLGR
jgi:hypothetical protein